MLTNKTHTTSFYFLLFNLRKGRTAFSLNLMRSRTAFSLSDNQQCVAGQQRIAITMNRRSNLVLTTKTPLKSTHKNTTYTTFACLAFLIWRRSYSIARFNGAPKILIHLWRSDLPGKPKFIFEPSALTFLATI